MEGRRTRLNWVRGPCALFSPRGSRQTQWRHDHRNAASRHASEALPTNGHDHGHGGRTSCAHLLVTTTSPAARGFDRLYGGVAHDKWTAARSSLPVRRHGDDNCPGPGLDFLFGGTGQRPAARQYRPRPLLRRPRREHRSRQSGIGRDRMFGVRLKTRSNGGNGVDCGLPAEDGNDVNQRKPTARISVQRHRRAASSTEARHTTSSSPNQGNDETWATTGNDNLWALSRVNGRDGPNDTSGDTLHGGQQETTGSTSATASRTKHRLRPRKEPCFRGLPDVIVDGHTPTNPNGSCEQVIRKAESTDQNEGEKVPEP